MNIEVCDKEKVMRGLKNTDTYTFYQPIRSIIIILDHIWLWRAFAHGKMRNHSGGRE